MWRPTLHTRAQTLKAEFHAQVKSFFRNAKENIDELAAELFYDDGQRMRRMTARARTRITPQEARAPVSP